LPIVGLSKDSGAFGGSYSHAVLLNLKVTPANVDSRDSQFAESGSITLLNCKEEGENH
jgi:hypothetical protein